MMGRKKNNSHFCKKFSSIIKRCRGEIKQEEFAKILTNLMPSGETIVNQVSISNYEKMKSLPSLETFYAIVIYSGESADKLLEEIFETYNK